MTGIHSGQRGPIRQGFGMIRLESSSSDCPMGMSFWGRGVNPSYTHSSFKRAGAFAKSPLEQSVFRCGTAADAVAYIG